MLKYGSGRSASSIGNGMANGGDDVLHHLPVLHAQVAGELLLNRELDLGTNQSGTGGEEDGRIGLGRLDHSLTTLIGPDFGEILQKSGREGCPRANWASIRIS